MSRVYNVHAFRCMTASPIAVGGVQEVGYAPTYRDVIQSTSDGAIGVEDVDRAGLRVATRLRTTDVEKVVALLSAIEADLQFSGVKSPVTSATKTLHHVVMKRNLFTGFSMSISKAQDAVANLDGSLRGDPAASPADTLKTLVTITENTTAPTSTYPLRVYRPNGAVFDPGTDISPKHLQSIDLSMSAEVEEDYGDTDVCMVARDIVGWGALQVSMTFRDQTLASGENMCSQLLGADRGTLFVPLLGRAGGANPNLSINNLLWTGAPTVTKGRGYWEFTVSGSCGWRNIAGGTSYTMAQLLGITES